MSEYVTLDEMKYKLQELGRLIGRSYHVQRMASLERQVSFLIKRAETAERERGAAERRRIRVVEELFDIFGNNGLVKSHKQQYQELESQLAKQMGALERAKQLIHSEYCSTKCYYHDFIDAILTGRK